MFTPPKHVACHVLHVTCHMSRVTCHIFFFFWTKWWSLSVEGLLSTRPTPSSLLLLTLNTHLIVAGPLCAVATTQWLPVRRVLLVTGGTTGYLNIYKDMFAISKGNLQGKSSFYVGHNGLYWILNITWFVRPNEKTKPFLKKDCYSHYLLFTILESYVPFGWAYILKFNVLDIF